VISVGHAIIRHRLMDVKVVIRKGVTYVSAIACSAIAFLLVARVLSRMTGYDQNTIPIVDAFLVAVAMAIVFQPLKNWIQRSFNRYFYRESYDYQRTVRDASRRLSTMLELDPLLQYLSGVIADTFKAEAVVVYLKDSAGRAYTERICSTSERLTSALPHRLLEDSPLLTLLVNARRVLVREEIPRDADALSMSAARSLAELGAEIMCPLMDDHTIMGTILVGPKRSGDPYFAEDIDLLATLTSQASIAMKNAQLYREVTLVNEYIDNILSTMESGVVAINLSGDVSLFNPAAERLIGRRLSRGLSYEALPVPLTTSLQHALKAQTPRSQFETSIEHPDGFTVPLVCSTAALSYQDGSTHGALIVLSDVTRLKELEREKRRAERLASFGAFASGIAHEIKNPLVAIRTFAELLPERFNESDFRDDFAKVVIREITRIDNLVGRLRGIAATAPQRQTISVDIREPIRDTLRLLRAQLEQSHTRVHYDFQDNSPFVAVDEAQLTQLFLNLLLNAIEAMGNGGEVFIQVNRRDRHGADWIVVEVSDTGPGIPASLRNSVFDPFFTTKTRGSGLGLSICRGITDAHHGSIRVDERVDRSGTAIVVEFPANAERSSVAEEVLHG